MGLDIETLTWKPVDPASNAEVARYLVSADVVVSTLPAKAADPLAGPVGEVLDRSGGTRPGAVLLDVVYDPWPTALAEAWARGGGAVPQVQLMTGQHPDIELMREALLSALAIGRQG